MHDIQRRILQLAQTKDLGSLSLRSIGEMIGVKYPNHVRHHLLSMLKSDLLRKDPSGKVTIGKRMEGTSTLSLIAVPIRGSANCGEATIFADDVVEGYLRVSTKLVNPGKKLFAVRASGNSMNLAKAGDRKESIDDGDYVIVDATDRVPRSGDYIVGVIDGLANIKLFSKDHSTGQVALVSESTEDHPPIFLHEDDMERFFVAGKVKSVLKKPKS